MRRKEKEISSRGEIDEIISKCQICHLGMALNDQPYVIPVNFGHDGDQIYFHTAGKGKKLDILALNPRVCFQMECNTGLVAGTPEPCDWSFAFESIVGFGQVHELIQPKEKKEGLMHIVRHYGGKAALPAEKKMAAVRVWCIRIEEVTGKRSMP